MSGACRSIAAGKRLYRAGRALMENVAETLGKNAETSQNSQARRVYKSFLTPVFFNVVTRSLAPNILYSHLSHLPLITCH